jgi:GNAT superfamily N-acetyltransferase
MPQAWTWTEEIWRDHFGEPLLGAYAVERVDLESYWRCHETELRRHFPKEVFFDMKGLLSEDERRGLDRIVASEGERLLNCCLVRRGEELAAVFSGHLRPEGVYRMWHSHVHPDHRGRGLYSEILRRTLAYSRAIGCTSVVSEHAPGNNAILIAKLKAGFRIIGMEIDPAVGASINLKYFHNPEHLAAYEFRCGLATLDEQLLRHGAGAMPLLVEQFRRFGGAGPG